MVAGHLQIKKGYYYAVLSWNSGEKRKTKWVPLGLYGQIQCHEGNAHDGKGVQSR